MMNKFCKGFGILKMKNNLKKSVVQYLYSCVLVTKYSMNLERYEFFAYDTLEQFEFISAGPKGKIKKMVQFVPRHINGTTYFHLCLGDWDETRKDINDLIVTNNHDTKKDLATVAAIILAFTEQFADMSVYATGSTPARTRLYQMGIAANWQEIEPILKVSGYINEGWQSFKKGVNYKAFLVQKRQLNFRQLILNIMKETKDRIVVTKTGIKYTISNKVKRVKSSIFDKRADESVEFLKKVGFPKEFLKKK